MASRKTPKNNSGNVNSTKLQLIAEGTPDPAISLSEGALKSKADCQWEKAFFLHSGIGKPHVERAYDAALHNHTTVEKELMASGLIDCDLYYRWLASELGLDYIDHIDPLDVVRLSSMDVLLHSNGPLRLSRGNGTVTLITPEARTLEAEKARLAARPELRKSLAVSSPATIRRCVWQVGESERVRQTTYRLDQDYNRASARQVLTGTQGFVLALLMCLGIAGLSAWPYSMFTLLHVVLTLFFLGGTLLRLCALLSADRARSRPGSLPIPDKQLPIYTLLIALRDEAEIAPAIVARIAVLEWPKSRLDVKYICEADDEATIAALEAQRLGSESEIVRVPKFGPQTKPKALQYALSGARGSLVAVYDAEDKPAPGQLHEAWARFDQGDERLGCLQAPLAIANLGSGWLSGLFALEYSGLFRVLIPFLAKTGMPIPLGGTSNHFRRAVLEEVGGWDSHNVTEDADLGMRLYAHGYRTGIIKRATVEVSPVTRDVWIKQRTRWLKGWAQTWLVTMRQPLTTFNSLGPIGFCVFQLMIGGMLVSALAHPLMYVFIALTLAFVTSDGAWAVSNLQFSLMVTDLVNISSSYLTFALIGWKGFSGYERTKIKRRWVLLTPLYWLLMSYAGWRAVKQLVVNAHLWEKTPHPATDLKPTSQ